MTLLLRAEPSLAAMVLAQGTLLLAAAWAGQKVFESRHARWRIVLWRCVLVMGVALPLLPFLPLPRWPVRIATVAAMTEENRSATSQIERPPTPGGLPPQGPEEPLRSGRAAEAARAISWSHILLAGWGAGFAWAALRLGALQRRLNQLRRSAEPADSVTTALALRIQEEMGVSRRIEVRQSDRVRSPFLSGILKPMILLPGATSGLSGEALPVLEAILRHEIAHFRQNDLPWCLGWRWLAACYWFHPLAWRAPEAHNLACEEEADRIAAGPWENRQAYAQSLAQVALQAIALPRVETTLTLNGACQLVRRLHQLRRAETGAWKRADSAAAFALAAALMLATGGWEVAKTRAADASQRREWRAAVVQVIGEGGRALAGATIEPYGFRVKGLDGASAYNWLSFGPRTKQTTDATGLAKVRYPVEAFPEEKMFTGKLNLIVSHPDYATQTVEISVDDDETPIRLVRAASVEVSGYFGPARQPVLKVAANLSGDPPAQFEELENGMLRAGQLPAGGYTVQLTGLLPSGELVFSEGHSFIAKKGETNRLSLEMKKGTRFEGRVDAHVQRPVTNGRAVIAVRPAQFPAYLVPEDGARLHEQYGYFSFWSTYRPIEADGTFSIEGIPPGEVDVIVHGDGFVSRNGGEPKNRVDGRLTSGLVVGVPQAFQQKEPVTRVEVATEPAVTLRVTTKTPAGQPISGTTLYVNPNVMRVRGGIFGHLPRSGEKPFRDLPDLSESPNYSAVTDDKGVAVLRNIPAVSTGLSVEHPQFEPPLDPRMHDRWVRLQLVPGETRETNLVLQPKGKDFRGSF